MARSAAYLRPFHTKLLLNNVPGATVGYAFERINARYSGFCINVRRSSDNTNQDIGFVGNAFDVAAYNAFVGGGTGFLRRWYDQMGNRNLVQGTNALQPAISLTGGPNGRPTIIFSGAQYIDGASAFSSALVQPVTVFTVGKYGGTQTDGVGGVFFSGPTSSHLMQMHKTSTNHWALNSGSSVVSNELDTTGWNIFTAFFLSGTAVDLRINGRSVFTGNGGANDWTQLRLGADATPGTFLNGRISELIIYPSTPSVAQRLVIYTYLSSRFQIACSPTGGASITAIVQDAGLTHAYVASCIKRRASDNALILTYTDWTNTNSPIPKGEKLHIRFSNDNGATWTAQDTALASDGGGAVSGFPMQPGTYSLNQGLSEPWMIVAPSGALRLFMWKTDFGSNNKGTWQSNSTDGGLTWSAPAQVTFGNCAGDSQDLIFATDDDFNYAGTIYAAARICQSDATGNTPERNALITSTDDGLTWTRVSNMSAYTDCTVGKGTLEVGFELTVQSGVQTIVAVLRPIPGSTTITGWTTKSTDLGATWAAVTEITTQTLGTGRCRINTVAHLLGQDNWWLDQRLVMNGFVGESDVSLGGSGHRRSAVWISYDGGVTWNFPIFPDTEGVTSSGSYGTMFYDATHGQYVYVTVRDNASNAAILNQYNMQLLGL